MSARKPDRGGSTLESALSRHLNQPCRVNGAASFSGSSNVVSLLDISCGDARHGVALRTYDLESESFDPDGLAFQFAVRTAAHERGLTVDTAITSASGNTLFAVTDRVLASVHEILPGEVGRWQGESPLQGPPGTAGLLGQHQADWDAACGAVDPAGLLASTLSADDLGLLARAGRAVDHTRVVAKFVAQTTLTDHYELHAGDTNTKRFDALLDQFPRSTAASDGFRRLLWQWAEYLRDWFDRAYDEQRVLPRRERPILQHGDQSLENAFFLPSLREPKRLHGYIDFDLTRYSSFRADLGVAGSLRFGDHLEPQDEDAILRGRLTGAPLQLRGSLQEYLQAYVRSAESSNLPTENDIRSIRLLSTANVLGLVLWCRRMIASGIYTDAAMTRYLAMQIHRLCVRDKTPASEWERMYDELMGLVMVRMRQPTARRH